MNSQRERDVTMIKARELTVSNYDQGERANWHDQGERGM